MKRKFEELADDLSWFVEQRQDLILALDITDHEVAYVLKTLEVVEAKRAGDVFMMFAHEAHDACTYVEAVMDSVRVQLDGINALQEKDGEPPWPELPAECDDPRRVPSERIRSLVGWVRQRLPEGRHHVVLGLLPVKVNDQAEYAEVVGGLLPRGGIEPWMVNLRILVRDDRKSPFLLPALTREPMDRVLIYDRLDLSPSAMLQTLMADAQDPELAEGERMTALVQLAALDYSHRRYDESYRKWGILFDYYARMETPTMQALCLCGAGDALREQGKLDEAKRRYQQGLALAQRPEALPVTLNLLAAVGDLCLRREEWVEAEGYLNLADQVASKTMQIYAKCDIMEQHGVALLYVGKPVEARTKWRATADLSREFKHYTRSESALRRLMAYFEAAHMAAERQACARELEEVAMERKTLERGREAAR